MIIKKDGTIAIADDFENVTIELTPIEWQELVTFFEYRKHNDKDIVRPGKKYPNPLSKVNRTIYQKLMENKPKLKEE